MFYLKFLIILIPLFFLSGCVPATQKAIAVPDAVIIHDLEKNFEFSDQNGTRLVRQWWKAFGDIQLDTIIEQALLSAPSLQTLEARYAQANSIIDSAESRNLPHISADASVIRERFSENHIFPAPLGGSTNNQYQPELKLDYDFDFWNARSSRISSAKNNALAQRASIEAAKIALSGAMCEIYLSWNYDEQKISLLEVLEHSTKEEQKIVENQYRLGLSDAVDINTKRGSLFQIRQRIEELKRSIEGKKEALCVLGGFLPSYAQSLKTPQINETFHLPVPKDVVLNLLAHRPDVAVVKYTVLSKSDTIEEAKAQFYPNISLSGALGFTSFSWAKLIDHSSYTPSAGIALSLPLFDWGMRNANLQNSVSDYNASVYEYNGVIIKAANEVVMLLKQSDHLKSQRQFHERELEFKKANMAITHKKLLLGLSNKLPYLASFKTLKEGEFETLSLNETNALLQINLIKSLGGGYTDNEDTNASR